ncbi:MAG: type II secretion system F family protein [Pseudomonadota bacterium]
MIWTATAAIFLGILALCLAGGLWVFRGDLARHQARRQRLQDLAPTRVSEPHRVLWRDRSLSTIPLLDRMLKAMPRVSDVQLLLLQAGNPCNLGTLVLMCGVAATLGCLLGLWRDSGLLAANLAWLGALVPISWLRYLRKKRLQAFDEQFPDAVEMMARALRAGHSFASALHMVGEESEDPVAGEFAKAFEDYSFGKSLEHALNDLVRRVGLQDVKFFVTAVVLQKETGGNLAEILDNIGGIIRERFRLMRQVRTLSAEGRLSGIILSLMPPALLLLLWIVSPGYVAMLFEHPMGNTILATGAGFQVLGMLVIRRLINIKV